MKCRICGNSAEAFSTACILAKYQVRYFWCPRCEFIQTEEPYWLNEAYSQPINRSDIGYVTRNLFLSRISKALIVTFFKSNGQFIDYGGGYGLYTRLMRDLGFDFRRSDKFCPNLFAIGFEAEAAGHKQYEVLTAFEVFEHLADPLLEVEKMLAFSDSIFLSTELQPRKRPTPNEWWYYGLDHGQHVSLYSLHSLQVIAEKFGLNLYSNGQTLHLLTKKSLSPRIFRLITRRRTAALLHLILRRNSLAPDDHRQVLQLPIST